MTTDDEIRTSLAALRDRLLDLAHETESVHLRISQIQRRCPHNGKKRWTNNDGDGQFIVERCDVCGLQRDGGI